MRAHLKAQIHSEDDSAGTTSAAKSDERQQDFSPKLILITPTSHPLMTIPSQS